jgi:microsomal dipeptidase-like Zn-dependent dipeptidase
MIDFTEALDQSAVSMIDFTEAPLKSSHDGPKALVE